MWKLSMCAFECENSTIFQHFIMSVRQFISIPRGPFGPAGPGVPFPPPGGPINLKI